MEAATIQIMKNEKRADAGRAIESVYAEYQKELFEQYGILGIEATYESGEWKESHILNRLSYYGMENMETQVEAIRLLTDQGGKPFFEQAVNYQKEKLALKNVDKFLGTYDSWQEQMKLDDQYEEKLDGFLEGEASGLPQENNPFTIISDIKRNSLINMVMPRDYKISENQINLSEQVSHRRLRTGEEIEEGKTMTNGDAVFFNFYLVDNFKSAIQNEEKEGLKYELEYLVAGKKSDKENLEAVLKNICHIRFLSNYVCISTDEVKKAEANVMAGALCSMIPVPGIIEVATQAILLAWAYGESIVDLRVLMEGNKVDLIKTKDKWQLSLEGLMELRKKPLDAQSNEGESGITYEQYLQLMLLLEKKEMLSMRALDLIELQIAKNMEQTYFRADNCIVGSTIHTKCRLQRGITYQFAQTYQYH